MQELFFGEFSGIDAAYKIVLHAVVCRRSPPHMGNSTLTKKVKFRALHPWEKGYIKEDVSRDGFVHIAIVEV